jgi:hypothetical protein
VNRQRQYFRDWCRTGFKRASQFYAKTVAALLDRAAGNITQPTPDIIDLQLSTKGPAAQTKTATEAAVSGKSTFNRYATFLRLAIPIRPGSPEPKSLMAAGTGIDETVIHVPLLPCTL